MSRLRSATPPLSAPAITLSWLVRLRWWALAGQVATMAITRLSLDVSLPAVPLALIVTATALTNAALLAALRRRGAVRPWLVPAALVFDTLSLTGLLYFTGGPSNPFSVLYLVHVTLAAVVRPIRWTSALVVLSALCYALLFFAHVPVPLLSHVHHHPGGFPSLHLSGMWVAFAVAAALIAYFVTHVTAALRDRDARLAEAERMALRQKRLSSLATLAAGAAHELGTPLGTIAIAARELERALERTSADASFVEDARLIRAETARCRAILQDMTGKTGDAEGEGLEPTRLRDVLDDVQSRLALADRSRLTVSLPESASPVLVPRRGLAQVLASLVRNGLDAGEGAVALGAAQDDACLRFFVVDAGSGMDPDVLQRAGEPFFTTKPPGSGTGLGVFLARSFAERWGGELTLASTAGAGTRAVLELPLRREEEQAHGR